MLTNDAPIENQNPKLALAVRISRHTIVNQSPDSRFKIVVGPLDLKSRNPPKDFKFSFLTNQKHLFF